MLDCVFELFLGDLSSHLHIIFDTQVAVGVLVASHLCIQSRSKGFGGSASAHTNQAVDFWWIYLFVGVTHKLHRV
jgi:hypothetical protein